MEKSQEITSEFIHAIKKNYESIRKLIQDDSAMEQICFQNAYELFGFWK
jgi:hypothetical protein